MSQPTAINGSFEAAETQVDRVVFGERAVLTVEPCGRTLARRDVGIKWPGGRKVVHLVGEIDGVRCYVDEAAGRVVLTRRTMRP